MTHLKQFVRILILSGLLFPLGISSEVFAQDTTSLELDTPVNLESSGEGDILTLTYEATAGEVLVLHVDATGETSRGLEVTITDSEGNKVIGGSHNNPIHTILPTAGTHTLTMVSQVEGTYQVLATHPQEIAAGEVVEGTASEDNPAFFVYRPESGVDFGLDFQLTPQEDAMLNYVVIRPYEDDGGLIPNSPITIDGNSVTEARAGYISYVEGRIYLVAVRMYTRREAGPSAFSLEIITRGE